MGPIDSRLKEVFDDLVDRDGANFRERRQDFVFHMMDWKKDLVSLGALYSEPGRFSRKEAARIVQAFLYHASSHIVAAARLTGHFLDTFGDRGKELRRNYGREVGKTTRGREARKPKRLKVGSGAKRSK